MAYEILVDGKDISTMEIESAPKVTKMYNKTICDELGITVPDDYEAISEAGRSEKVYGQNQREKVV